MGVYRLPIHVEERIGTVLDAGAEAFGEAARERYAAVILRAMQDVADNPGRPGSMADTDADPTALFYHIKHSRDRAGQPGNRVGRPRHILVYEPAGDGVVDILGLIPDVIPSEIALPFFIPER
jgi:toxin ParE1/3/4